MKIKYIKKLENIVFSTSEILQAKPNREGNHFQKMNKNPQKKLKKNSLMPNSYNSSKENKSNRKLQNNQESH